ncbi:MAG: hypothetical protein Q9227_003167 [Pyrenula ochraceoflavens]
MTIHNDRETIVVIGAGVWGLTTANLLRERQPTSRVAIVAAEFPGDPNPSVDYASMWAGAHYRPVPGNSAQLRMEEILAKRTFKKMQRIAKDEPEAGVEVVRGVEYLENPEDVHSQLKSGDEYAGPGDGFRVLEKDELPLEVRWGCEYASYCVNVPIYCSWLLWRFIASGGKVIKARLGDAKEAFDIAKEDLGHVRIVVNCSGRNFDNDPSGFVIRGQTCLVRTKYPKTVTRQNKDGTWVAIIPRPLNGGTIIGVSKEPHDLEDRPRAETRDLMLSKVKEQFTDLLEPGKDFEIIRDNVGRRPARQGGPRLEIEMLADGRRKIVHGYGAGGRGYELSWGIAERLVDLIGEGSDSKTATSKL